MRATRILMSVVTVLATLATALVVAVAAPTSANAASQDNARVQVRSVSASYDAQVLYWTNVMRKRHGMKALRAGACVDRFAESWTARMASRDSFSHQSLRPILRHCRKRRAAENIAYGTGSLSPYAVVKMWMNSSGHRKNILNRKYKRLGVGTWRSADTGRIYVTQDFVA